MDNKAGNISNNRFLDEVEVVAGRNSRRDSEDMLDNAWDASVASSRVVDVAHIDDRAVVVLNRHLNESNTRKRKKDEDENNE